MIMLQTVLEIIKASTVGTIEIIFKIISSIFQNQINEGGFTKDKKASDKEVKSQMDRVAEIMRVTSDSVVETLSNKF